MAALSVEEKKTARRGDQRGSREHRGGAARRAAQSWPKPSCRRSCAAEALDVTLPGRQRGAGRPASGQLAPWSASRQSSRSMGFDVADGPEIETDWINFTALNTPENHPARSMHDTFYVDMKDEQRPLADLRTAHQPDAGPLMPCACRNAHAADAGRPMPEIRVIAPGRTYRVDSDATHSPMFHQCEGLWIGENVSFKDLKVRVHRLPAPLLRDGRPPGCAFALASSRSPSPAPRSTCRSPAARSQGRWLEVAGSRPGASQRGAQLRRSTPSATSALPSAWALTG
jgi:phenylalanyl-tRNA synthetase alpha chain